MPIGQIEKADTAFLLGLLLSTFLHSSRITKDKREDCHLLGQEKKDIHAHRRFVSSP